MEKTLIDAASIWGHNLNMWSREVLTTCQRLFLLAIVKPYKTFPTAAHQVLAAVIPIHLLVKIEAAYWTISRFKETVNMDGTTIHHIDYNIKINVCQTHPAETAEPRLGHYYKDIIMYTDGSKLELGATGSAFRGYRRISKTNKPKSNE